MEQNAGKNKLLAVDFVLGTAALCFASARHPDGPAPKYRHENEQEQNIHRYSPFESNAPPTKHVTPLSAKPTMRQTEAQGALSANMSVTSPITAAAAKVCANRPHSSFCLTVGSVSAA
jgi:hypothetical protein